VLWLLVLAAGGSLLWRQYKAGRLVPALTPLAIAARAVIGLTVLAEFVGAVTTALAVKSLSAFYADPINNPNPLYDTAIVAGSKAYAVFGGAGFTAALVVVAHIAARDTDGRLPGSLAGKAVVAIACELTRCDEEGGGGGDGVLRPSPAPPSPWRQS
jgi:hypothetical protein